MCSCARVTSQRRLKYLTAACVCCTCQLAVLLSAVLGLIGDVIGRDLQEEARKRIIALALDLICPCDGSKM